MVDPDAAALATTYSYFENANEPGRYRRVSSVSNPDGSWEKYDYDAEGNRTLVLRPWLDLTLAAATSANARATTFTVGRFFNRNAPYGIVGCNDASSIILTQGLIKVVGPGLYDEVLSRMGGDLLGILKTRMGQIGTMLEGDSGWLPNYDDYQGLPNVGDYGHENSIKIAQNSYFGHPLGRFNAQRLERLLQNAYVNAGGNSRRDPIPGLHNKEEIEITFIDVAKVFGVIFDIRHDQAH